MRKSRLLLVGMTGLANEVAKNLVLAGIGSLLLIDRSSVTAADLGSQFFLRESDIGRNVYLHLGFVFVFGTGDSFIISFVACRGLWRLWIASRP
jgi:hypothetical protein